MKKIELGSKVKCKISGFIGIVSARVEYLHGSPNLKIVAESKDGKMPEQDWVDETSVEVIE